MIFSYFTHTLRVTPTRVRVRAHVTRNANQDKKNPPSPPSFRFSRKVSPRG
jgi:hypothetical protein